MTDERNNEAVLVTELNIEEMEQIEAPGMLISD